MKDLERILWVFVGNIMYMGDDASLNSYNFEDRSSDEGGNMDCTKQIRNK